jgi:hypothetical protein
VLSAAVTVALSTPKPIGIETTYAQYQEGNNKQYVKCRIGTVKQTPEKWFVVVH